MHRRGKKTQLFIFNDRGRKKRMFWREPSDCDGLQRFPATETESTFLLNEVFLLPNAPDMTTVTARRRNELCFSSTGDSVHPKTTHKKKKNQSDCPHTQRRTLRVQIPPFSHPNRFVLVHVWLAAEILGLFALLKGGELFWESFDQPPEVEERRRNKI